MALRVSELGNGAAKAGNGHARAALGSYGDLDDRMLVLDFQAGNSEAFSEIHRRYSGLARHVCQRILRNPEDADEATQEAMLRVYQGLSRFNGRYALQPWVARIATNVSLDVTRARARRPRTGDQPVTDLHDDLHDRSGDPQEVVEQTLDREQINRVLAELPNHHREALVLREFEGRSHKEIGEAMGVTPSQAKALIHRAKGSFRRTWNGGKGLQALVFVVAALGRVPQLVKRLVQPAQELAASSAAAPAATASAVTTGERVTAAAVAVLVAGSAAVGAVALKPKSHEVRPVSSPSPVVAPVTAPDRALTREDRLKGRAISKLLPALLVTSPRPTAKMTPPPAGSESPSSTPVPEPEGFALTFISDVSTDYRCDCGTEPVITSHVSASDDDVSSFSATVDQAGAADSTGEIAWSLWLEESSPDAKGQAMTFVLTTPDGPYRYTAQGTLVSQTKTAWGGETFVFQGTYSFYSGPTSPGATASIPGYGTYHATVSVSSATSRVVNTSITLIGTPSAPSPSPSASPSPSSSPTS